MTTTFVQDGAMRHGIDETHRRFEDAFNRGDASSSSAHGRRQHRSAGLVRTQRHRRALEAFLPEHFGVGRGVRRARPLVVPDGCLSQL